MRQAVAANASSPTDGRLTRTLAAAPRAAASPRSAGDRQVARGVGVAPPGQLLGRGDEVATRLDAGQRDLGCDPRCRLQRRRPGRPLVVGLLGQLERGREPRVGVGVAVGEGQEAGRPARRPCAPAAAWAASCSAYFGRPADRAATIATSPAPSAAATADALPPPGTGSADARRSTKSPTGEVAESLRLGLHPPIVGGVPAGPRDAPAGRARYRRTRPARVPRRGRRWEDRRPRLGRS